MLGGSESHGGLQVGEALQFVGTRWARTEVEDGVQGARARAVEGREPALQQPPWASGFNVDLHETQPKYEANVTQCQHSMSSGPAIRSTSGSTGSPANVMTLCAGV